MIYAKSVKREFFKKGRTKRTLTIIAFIAILLLCIIYISINMGVKNHYSKAAIVDQLSASWPNQTFWQTSKAILKMAGFDVYYYASMAVNVEFYRNLPTHGFKLIILRVHSAIAEGSDFVCLFTSEPYDDDKAGTTYLFDVLNGWLVKTMMYEGAPEYFGITPLFVKEAMIGSFDGAIIIMMGCDGLTYMTMAEAFIEKGAKVYIGWNGPVSASHTDHATSKLLQNLISNKNTIEDAVRKTNDEVGADPTYRSKLLFYPPEARNYTVSCYIDKGKGTFNQIICLMSTYPKRRLF